MSEALTFPPFPNGNLFAPSHIPPEDVARAYQQAISLTFAMAATVSIFGNIGNILTGTF